MMGLLTLPNMGMFLRLKDEVGEPGRPHFKTSCNLPPYRWRESRRASAASVTRGGASGKQVGSVSAC